MNYKFNLLHWESMHNLLGLIISGLFIIVCCVFQKKIYKKAFTVMQYTCRFFFWIFDLFAYSVFYDSHGPERGFFNFSQALKVEQCLCTPSLSLGKVLKIIKNVHIKLGFLKKIYHNIVQLNGFRTNFINYW